MVWRAILRTKNHRFARQILNNHFELAVIDNLPAFGPSKSCKHLGVDVQCGPRGRSVHVPSRLYMIEGAPRLFAMPRDLHARRVRELNVGPTITIVVDKSHSPAHRLNYDFCFRARLMFKVDPGLR